MDEEDSVGDLVDEAEEGAEDVDAEEAVVEGRKRVIRNGCQLQNLDALLKT